MSRVRTRPTRDDTCEKLFEAAARVFEEQGIGSASNKSIAAFIDALKTMDRSQQDPLGRSPLLHMEMILFVARAEKRRPELAKRLRARRQLITDIVETALKNAGRSGSLDPAWTGAILLALEDGFRLHRLIDPETTPADSFLQAIGDLQRAVRTTPA